MRKKMDLVVNMQKKIFKTVIMGTVYLYIFSISSCQKINKQIIRRFKSNFRNNTSSEAVTTEALRMNPLITAAKFIKLYLS